MNITERWKNWAGRLRREAYALYLVCRDPRVPLHARLFAALVIVYAFSPLDLIPDFVPVLGYLDDLILVPLGVLLAIRMIPGDVLAECRESAAETVTAGNPIGRAAAAAVVAVWLLLAALAVAVVVAAIDT